jgi:hypothetical protein
MNGRSAPSPCVDRDRQSINHPNQHIKHLTLLTQFRNFRAAFPLLALFSSLMCDRAYVFKEDRVLNHCVTGEGLSSWTVRLHKIPDPSDCRRPGGVSYRLGASLWIAN